jgi:hypothetical protein
MSQLSFTVKFKTSLFVYTLQFHLEYDYVFWDVLHYSLLKINRLYGVIPQKAEFFLTTAQEPQILHNSEQLSSFQSKQSLSLE